MSFLTGFLGILGIISFISFFFLMRFKAHQDRQTDPIELNGLHTYLIEKIAQRKKEKTRNLVKMRTSEIKVRYSPRN